MIKYLPKESCLLVKQNEKLAGDFRGIYGDCRLHGGVYGDASNISGDVRIRGIDINELFRIRE